jgi:cellulose synthase/poly-beta-1,6-N-acetylglucosamine synthase-like glycosyltransferase
LTITYLALGRAGMKRLDSERRALNPPKKHPMVSIIVAAYRSQKTIARTLESASKIDYPRKEIIVINDSQDSTPSIARSFGARVVQNRKRMGKPHGLNTATKLARGDLLFILDSDTTASRDTLKRIVPWFSDDAVAAVMPRYLLRNRRGIARLASLENLFTFAILRVHMFFGSMAGFRGCSVVIRKSILEKHPWPNTLLEDNHLSATLLKHGHRIIWEPRAVTWTDEPATMGELKRQRRRWGEGAFLAFREHKRFYLRSTQFMTFLYPYLTLGAVWCLLMLSLLLSPVLFPALTIPILTEIVIMFIATYLHTLIFLYLGGGRFLPLQSLAFMLIYMPITSCSYSLGVLTGIRRRKHGRTELNFRNW